MVVSQSPPALRRQDAGAGRRQAIVEAAVLCLAELGYAGATIQLIARRAGISHGPIQYHYEDKRALMVGVAEHLFAHRVAFFRMHEAPRDRRGFVHYAFERTRAYARTPEQMATMELELGMRADARLAEVLGPVLEVQERLASQGIAAYAAAAGARADAAYVSAMRDLLALIGRGAATAFASEWPAERIDHAIDLLEALILANPGA